MVKAREEVIVEVEADSELAKALGGGGRTPGALVSNEHRPTLSCDSDDLWAELHHELTLVTRNVRHFDRIGGLRTYRPY